MNILPVRRNASKNFVGVKHGKNEETIAWASHPSKIPKRSVKLCLCNSQLMSEGWGEGVGVEISIYKCYSVAT